MHNDGKITVEYTVADWDDGGTDDLGEFDYPSYTNPMALRFLKEASMTSRRFTTIRIQVLLMEVIPLHFPSLLRKETIKYGNLYYMTEI